MSMCTSWEEGCLCGTRSAQTLRHFHRCITADVLHRHNSGTTFVCKLSDAIFSPLETRQHLLVLLAPFGEVHADTRRLFSLPVKEK